MKYILITGASSGIGFYACRFLLDKGYFVFGTVRTEEDRKRLMNSFPGNFEALLLDLTSKTSISKIENYLKKKLDKTGLFALINNAGIAYGGPMMHVSDEDFEMQMNTNLNSVFYLSKALLPLLGASFNSNYQPGRIVNISSVSGLINTPMLGPYCISKHALESLSDILRRELALFGVKVVLLAPGPIKTPIWEKSIPKNNPLKGTDYENIYHVFSKRVNKSAKNALPVEVVSKYISKALEKTNPSPRYIISKNKLAIKIIHNFIPTKWMDKLFVSQLKKSIEFIIPKSKN